MRARLVALVLLLTLGGSSAPGALLVAADAPEGSEAADGLDPAALPDRVPVTVRGPEGQHRSFTAEVAADWRSRRRGLMHRTSLPEDAGMLFVFPQDTTAGFWMRDTRIPLTIAFARADGTIITVRDMTPCPDGPCPSYHADGPYRLALEVNQGALGDAEPGWRIEVGAPPG